MFRRSVLWCGAWCLLLFVFLLFPSENAKTGGVEPYNVVVSTHNLLENAGEQINRSSRCWKRTARLLLLTFHVRWIAVRFSTIKHSTQSEHTISTVSSLSTNTILPALVNGKYHASQSYKVGLGNARLRV